MPDPTFVALQKRSATINPVTDAYAAAGVDTHEADRGVAAIVGVLKTIETGRDSLTIPLPGHYASVMRLPGGWRPISESRWLPTASAQR